MKMLSYQLIDLMTDIHLNLSSNTEISLNPHQGLLHVSLLINQR